MERPGAFVQRGQADSVLTGIGVCGRSDLDPTAEIRSGVGLIVARPMQIRRPGRKGERRSPAAALAAAAPRRRTAFWANGGESLD